jgi:S1-C subfamily serine protease
VLALGLATGPAHAAPARPLDFLGAGVGPASRTLDFLPQAPAAPVDSAAAFSVVAPALVDINTTLNYQSAVGAGTGIVLDPSGEVLTNNHVIEGATSITATSVASGRTYPVDVIGYDRGHDIALVHLRGVGDLPTAPLGGPVAVGDPIAAVGNTGGSGGQPTVAPGTVTGLGQTVTATDDSGGGARQLTGLIRVAANILPGDSGGALVNSAGQVVGVNTAATLQYRMGGIRGGQGFAIPIDQALNIAGQIRSGGSNVVHVGDTAFLGVGVADGVADSGPAGALVRQALPDTPARQIGLTRGDLIVSIDGAPIGSAAALSDVFDQHHPGDTVAVGWLDGAGQRHTESVVLAAGPVG